MKTKKTASKSTENSLRLRIILLILLISAIRGFGQDTIRIPVLPAGKSVEITFEVQVVGNPNNPTDTIISSQLVVRGDSIEDTYSYDPEFNFFDTSFATITYTKYESGPTTLEESYNSDLTGFNFRVYPNPNKGIFTLSFELATQANQLQILIFNMQGVELYRNELKNFSGKYRNQFTDITFIPGIHFIYVNVDGISYRNSLLIKP